MGGALPNGNLNFLYLRFNKTQKTMAKRKTKKKAPITPAAPHDSLFKLTFGTKEIF